MKKLPVILILGFCYACSGISDQEFNPENGMVDTPTCESYKINGSKAVEIASLYFDRTPTRSNAPLEMGYIVDHSRTRSGAPGNDTIAYILNRGDYEGFVVVSSDNRVYPILAHSQTGTFKYKKGDPVETEFISRLGAYLKSHQDRESRIVIADDLDACVTSYPALTASWHQRAPWDKYVIQEHPGCPVGCVALATGMIMSHCKLSHVYHGINFELARITAGLKTNYYPWEEPLTRIVGGNTSGNNKPRPEVEPYSYDVAIDYAAKLLYWIGKDVHTSYSNGESSAMSLDAFRLLKKEGYDLKQITLTAYNVHDAIKYLVSNNLLYMRGSGHAWVADACSYCVDYANNDTIAAEIHCDWGWGGNCNGYYSGEVFYPDGHKYTDMTYFAVGIE